MPQWGNMLTKQNIFFYDRNEYWYRLIYYMHMYVYALAFNSLFKKCVRFIVDFLSYQAFFGICLIVNESPKDYFQSSPRQVSLPHQHPV